MTHAAGPADPAVISDALPRVIRRVALPAVASNLLQTLFASVDAFWVGTRIGSAGLAAVSTSLFWIWMVIALAEMIGVGLTAVAARRHGERRSDDAARVAGESLVLALVLGVVVGVSAALAVESLFSLMRTPAEVGALGRDYLRTYMLGAPLIFGYFAVDAAFRASGDTRTPLAILLVSTACTLLLDPVLILGLWGAPRLGIAGAAVALVLTRGSAFLVGAWLLHRRGLVRFQRPRLAPLATVARVGLPTAMTGIIFSIIYIAVTRTTTRFGTAALAAIGIGHRVESWLYMLGVGFGAAAAAIVGQNLGARQPARAARTGWITVGWASVPACALAIAALLVPESMVALFTHDPEVIEETARYLRITSLSILVLPCEVVLEGALGGAGDTVPPMLTSTFFSALRVPAAAWAASHWGTTGIWWTISLTAIGRALGMALLWRLGRWQRKSL